LTGKSKRKQKFPGGPACRSWPETSDPVRLFSERF
jgi:hypothetical protein